MSLPADAYRLEDQLDRWIFQSGFKAGRADAVAFLEAQKVRTDSQDVIDALDRLIDGIQARKVKDKP